MFDFDGAKLIIIGIVMLIVIKPKDLPGVMRQVGQAVAQLRRMAAEFQGQFTEAMREAELADLKKDVEKMTKLDLDGLDPFDSLRNDVQRTKEQIEAGLNTPASPPAETPVAETPASSLGEHAGSPEIGHIEPPKLDHDGQPHAVEPAHAEPEHAESIHAKSSAAQ
jgi:sec-independent protein translocase protein TatB